MKTVEIDMRDLDIEVVHRLGTVVKSLEETEQWIVVSDEIYVNLQRCLVLDADRRDYLRFMGRNIISEKWAVSVIGKKDAIYNT